MKTSQWAAVPAAVIAMCILAPSRLLAVPGNGNGNGQATFPIMPSGWLTAFPTIVQTGTKPTLTWGINYPSVVEDFVTVTPPATVTPKEELTCEIRILGLGVTSLNSNGTIKYYRTRGRLKCNGSSSWTTIYDGQQTDTIVQQQGIVKTEFTVNKNQPMYFSGQYYNNNNWQTEYTSTNGDNVRTLISGSTPPSNVPDYNAPSLEKFLKPYLDATGKVNIGPMDVIVFMELTHGPTQKTDIGYDLQDLVMLITYKSKAKNNNGHGNNIDGVDSSNPGNAPFIDLDTDPTIDDEGSGSGAAPSDP